MIASTLPLDRYRLFATQDVDDARDQIARVFCPHLLKPSRGSWVDTRLNRTTCGKLAVNFLTYGADVSIAPYDLERFYILQIPVTGHAHVTTDGQETVASRELATILSPTHDIGMWWSGDCGKILVQIERHVIEDAAQAMLDRPVNRPLGFDVAIPRQGGAGAHLMSLVELICQDLDGARVLTNGLPGARMAEALVFGLLNGQRHTYFTELETKVAGIAPAHVKRAEAFMREHLAEPIGVLDMARVAGVSVRALQEGFRRFRDTTPLEALRSLRLEAAHRELLGGAPGETVTTVALKWGFTHLSRFALSYKSRYRESPSATLRSSSLTR